MVLGLACQLRAGVITPVALLAFAARTRPLTDGLFPSLRRVI
jgi:hypothetical protein